MGPSAAEELVRQTTDQTTCAVERINRGRNSRVFKVRCRSGLSCIVKFYLQPTADGSSRLDNEWQALSFMHQKGFNNVPAPIFRDEDRQGAIFSYIPGKPVTHHTPDDLRSLLNFLENLKAVHRHPDADMLPSAAEACFCPAQLENNLRKRLNLLEQVPGDDAISRQMLRFLDKEIYPQMEKDLRRAGKSFPGDLWQRTLPRGHQTLSPSDFGFHNGLRTGNGLAFVDFEYFGHDDPVKAAADFLLHPAMELSEDEIILFYRGMADIFKGDEAFKKRFKAFLPLFRIKWITILLNEFLKSGLERRKFAEADIPSTSELQEAQLEKGANFLNKDQKVLAVLFD